MTSKYFNAFFKNEQIDFKTNIFEMKQKNLV